MPCFGISWSGSNLLHVHAVAGRRPTYGGGGEDGGDGRARIINAIINYVLNTCNRFRDCGDDKDGCTSYIMAVRPDLRFNIRR